MSCMDVTVYLPDAIGAKAKEEGINLSGTLRSAVEDELSRLETMRKSRDELGPAQEFKVKIISSDKEFTGRVTGWVIDRNSDWEVYLTADDRIIVYNEFRCEASSMSEDEARSDLSPELFPDALVFLGVEPIIDL